MGREGQWIDQPVNQTIDIANWKGDDEFEIYPEGARDKSLLISPSQSGYDFLIPGHRYLFKHSFQKGNRCHPDQYWAEIVAYRIGCMLDVPVPPAFVAYNSDNNVCGALIEWFLNYPDQPEERRVPGGDIMVDMIPGYDRKRGKEHNFVTIARYLAVVDKNFSFKHNWLIFWCDMLLFDAIIGNTDRHQDNWELLWNQVLARHVRMSPVFDNGTSLGYEILESKMDDFYQPDKMAAYIRRGRHHLRWQSKDELQCRHVDLLLDLAVKFPGLKGRIREKLALFDPDRLRSIMENCRQYSVPVPLTQKRADFICHLVISRQRTIEAEVNQL